MWNPSVGALKLMISQEEFGKLDGLSQVRYKATVIAIFLGIIGMCVYGVGMFISGERAVAILEGLTALAFAALLVLLKRTKNMCPVDVFLILLLAINILLVSRLTGTSTQSIMWWGMFPVVIVLLIERWVVALSLFLIVGALLALSLFLYPPPAGVIVLPFTSLVMSLTIYGFLTLAHSAMKKRLVRDLEKALEEVKTLQTLLPICMYCKKIRDDGGYWHKLESYMRSRWDGVSFSHGVCPDCLERLRSETGRDIPEHAGASTSTG